MTAEDQGIEALLGSLARRVAAAERLTPRHGDDDLVAIVGATVVALESQAASIALHDPATGRLVFTAASGPAAGDIVGMSIEAASGIAGYVFTTGQPLAVADVTADPRFERSVAEASGYMPSSLLAVPVNDESGAVGVLEALDRRGGTFSLHDLDVATSIAGIAALTLRRSRLRSDAKAVIGDALAGLLAEADGPAADPAAIEALASRATTGLARDDDPTWVLADRIARLRDIDPDAVELAVEWLDVLLRHRASRS